MFKFAAVKYKRGKSPTYPMKQLLLFLFVFYAVSASAQNTITVNDKNGDNRVSVGDVTYTIDAIQKGNNSYSTDDVDGVAQRLLEKRNVLVVWLATGKQELYYFNDEPSIRFEGDDIVISTAVDEILVNSEGKVYKSNEVLKITYDFIPKAHEGSRDDLEDILG